MTYDHRRAAVMELVKAAVVGQAAVENVVDAVMALTKPHAGTQWLPSDSEHVPDHRRTG